MVRNMCLSAVAVLTVALLPVRADDKKPFDDREFITKAASGGMLEVELGKVAVAHATNADVKAFGQKMIDDHTKANDELKTIATSAGVNLPAKLMDDHQKHFDKLKALTGEEFDRAYVKHMVKDHEENVAEFTRASKEAKLPGLKDFATKTLPTLQKHLDMVKKLDGRNE